MIPYITPIQVRIFRNLSIDFFNDIIPGFDASMAANVSGNLELARFLHQMGFSHWVAVKELNLSHYIGGTSPSFHFIFNWILHYRGIMHPGHAADRDAWGFSPACYAAVRGDPDLLEALLRHRADPNDRVRKLGCC